MRLRRKNGLNCYELQRTSLDSLIKQGTQSGSGACEGKCRRAYRQRLTAGCAEGTAASCLERN